MSELEEEPQDSRVLAGAVSGVGAPCSGLRTCSRRLRTTGSPGPGQRAQPAFLGDPETSAPPYPEASVASLWFPVPPPFLWWGPAGQ